MAKTTQVLKLNACGKKFTVIKDNAATINPYRVRLHFHEYNKYGNLAERKVTVARYQTMESVLYYLAQFPGFGEEV